MIMLGFAWQKGVIPVSSRALYRAIRLNGVDAEANLQAFELGRKAAHDPAAARRARGRRADAGDHAAGRPDRPPHQRS